MRQTKQTQNWWQTNNTHTKTHLSEGRDRDTPTNGRQNKTFNEKHISVAFFWAKEVVTNGRDIRKKEIEKKFG